MVDSTTSKNRSAAPSAVPEQSFFSPVDNCLGMISNQTGGTGSLQGVTIGAMTLTHSPGRLSRLYPNWRLSSLLKGVSPDQREQRQRHNGSFVSLIFQKRIA